MFSTAVLDDMLVTLFGLSSFLLALFQSSSGAYRAAHRNTSEARSARAYFPALEAQRYNHGTSQHDLHPAVSVEPWPSTTHTTAAELRYLRRPLKQHGGTSYLVVAQTETRPHRPVSPHSGFSHRCEQTRDGQYNGPDAVACRTLPGYRPHRAK